MSETRGQGFGGDTQLPSTTKGKKYFLGISINSYPGNGWNPLKNAVKDMEAVHQVLTQRYDFEGDAPYSTLLRNEEATRSNIEDTLYRFAEPGYLTADDALLIYYSGHGFLDALSTGYWVPIDAQKGKISTYLPNSRIRELIAAISCKHVLVIADACYSGSLFQVTKGSSSELVAVEYEKRKSRWAFCSGREDQEVSDGSHGNSPFAAALIQELSVNTQGKIHLSRMAESVTAITRAAYNQMPSFGVLSESGDLGGQFVFTLKTYDPATEPPPSIQKEEQPSGTNTLLQQQPILPANASIRQQAEWLFAEGKIFEVIQLLLQQQGSRTYQNAITLLSGRFHSLEREERNGLLSSDDARVQQNHFNKGLLDFINRLP